MYNHQLILQIQKGSKTHENENSDETEHKEIPVRESGTSENRERHSVQEPRGTLGAGPVNPAWETEQGAPILTVRRWSCDS